MKKILAIFIFALLGGCSWWFDDDYTIWHDWSGRDISAIINDSLAIVTKYKIKQNCHEVNTFEGSFEDCETVDGYTKLSIINYRQKIEPLLEDTINWLLDIQGQLSDSIVYGFNNSMKEIVFWKIGEKSIRKKINKRIGDCSSPYMWGVENRVRHWKSGQFLLLPKKRDFGNELNSCQYAVLDATSGIVTQGLFEGSEAWLANCEDIALIDGKTTCLRRPTDGSCGMDILLDNEVVDSIRFDNCYFSNLKIRNPFFIFYGTHIIDNTLNMRDCESTSAFNKIRKMLSYKFQLDYPNTWIEEFVRSSFHDGLCNTVRY